MSAYTIVQLFALKEFYLKEINFDRDRNNVSDFLSWIYVKDRKYLLHLTPDKGSEK